jgi:hypothetical protein
MDNDGTSPHGVVEKFRPVNLDKTVQCQAHTHSVVFVQLPIQVQHIPMHPNSFRTPGLLDTLIVDSFLTWDDEDCLSQDEPI